eukprot:TRINITY_DN3300_c0_g1_i1.p1 TRINITY_DN3300_c0_g1~~TRINITY_DN3300_c0_g1_i1.p1  ORF type:complete len:299 (+),score=95.39 TRINITY_DN3300_c0_g1_i1:493-1389(+)
MSGASIRFSKMRGAGGVDAWRDALASAASGGSSGSARPRTTGTKLPKTNTIFKATVVCVKEYGAFVQLEDGTTYRDGMLHISAMGKEVERVQDVVNEGMKIWVKVAEVTEDTGKYGVDIRYVSQRDGADLDPYNAKSHRLPDNHLPGNPNKHGGAGAAAAASGSTRTFGADFAGSAGSSGAGAAGQASAAAGRDDAAASSDDEDPCAKKRKKKEKKKRKRADSSDDSDDGVAGATAEELAAEREKARKKMLKAQKKLEKAKKKAEKKAKKKEKKEKKNAAKAKAGSSASSNASSDSGS